MFLIPSVPVQDRFAQSMHHSKQQLPTFGKWSKSMMWVHSSFMHLAADWCHVAILVQPLKMGDGPIKTPTIL